MKTHTILIAVLLSIPGLAQSPTPNPKTAPVAPAASQSASVKSPCAESAADGDPDRLCEIEQLKRQILVLTSELSKAKNEALQLQTILDAQKLDADILKNHNAPAGSMANWQTGRVDRPAPAPPVAPAPSPQPEKPKEK